MAKRKSYKNKAKNGHGVGPDNFLTMLVRDLISKNDHVFNEIGIIQPHFISKPIPLKFN